MVVASTPTQAAAALVIGQVLAPCVALVTGDPTLGAAARRGTHRGVAAEGATPRLETGLAHTTRVRAAACRDRPQRRAAGLYALRRALRANAQRERRKGQRERCAERGHTNDTRNGLHGE
jgi:hypothetical protein